MFRWAKDRFAGYLRQVAEKEIHRLIRLEDYENAFALTTKLTVGRDLDLAAQRLHAQVLVGLGRCREAMEIVARIEKCAHQGRIELTDDWSLEFAKLKCRTLYGIKSFDELTNHVHQCRELYPSESIFVAYEALVGLELASEETLKDCLESFDSRIDSIKEPWELIALWSAHNWLGNNERALAVAQVARQRFSDHPGAAELLDKSNQKKNERDLEIRFDSSHD